MYSGLNGVKLDRKHVAKGYFVTYISTSWKKEVSQAFMKGQGLMLHIDEKYRDGTWRDGVRCCDVSWISKFPDEGEILFARSLRHGCFQCAILDEVNGIQTVSLKQERGSLSVPDMYFDICK